MSSIIKPLYGSAISGRERDLIIGYEFDIQEGDVVNKEVSGSAGGMDGVLWGGTKQTQDPIFGRGARFKTDDGYIAVTQAGSTQSGTFAATFRFWETDVGDNFVIHHGVGIVARYYVVFTNTRLQTRFGNVGAIQNADFWYTEGKAFRLVVTWVPGTVNVYVDAVLVDTYAATFVDDLGAFFIGGRGPAIPGETLEHDEWDWKFYRRALSVAEVEADYREYAGRVQFYDKLVGLNVTPVVQTVGSLGGSPWEVGSGSWNIVDAVLPHDRYAKAYEAAVAGTIHLPRQYVNVLAEELPWGRHTFWILNADAADTGIFIADGINIGADNGYYVGVVAGTGELIVIEYTGGAATTIFSTAAGYVPADTWVKITLDRRDDGRFHIYMNDTLAPPTGVYTNPFTDTTHSSADLIAAILGAGSQLTGYSKTFGHLSL